MKKTWLAFLALALLSVAPSTFAQTETQIYSFAANASDGYYPISGVTFDSSGNLYGTTSAGGANSKGTVYKLTPSGSSWSESVLYSFKTSLDGITPYSGVILDSSGNLYGTTANGGQGFNNGTFYEISPGTSWSESGLFTFSGANTGQYPYDYGQLIRDSSGNFYGTTHLGGPTGNNQGTVFKISISGGVATETVLYSFGYNAYTHDGQGPMGGNLVLSGGYLYGTTGQGGTYNDGTVFSIDLSTGTETVLYNFGSTGDGVNPYAGLVMDSSGHLYGTTVNGGAHNSGTVFELSCGATSCTEQRLYSFGTNTNDGVQPWGSVILDSSGNVYGTALDGGAHNLGMVYKLAPNGPSGWTETNLHSFVGSYSDGGYPYGGLAMDSSGNLYGATYRGGANQGGMVFKIVP